MNERMPYYMAYPVPFSYDDERTERRDIEYLRSMYPDIPKRILPYVEEECDRMEYENSMVYDQYPDKLQLKLMCRRVCDNVCRHEHLCLGGGRNGGCGCDSGVSGSDRSGARESENIEAQSLRDLIEVMLFQEIYRRRCDHRRRCRRFY